MSHSTQYRKLDSVGPCGCQGREQISGRGREPGGHTGFLPDLSFSVSSSSSADGRPGAWHLDAREGVPPQARRCVGFTAPAPKWRHALDCGAHTAGRGTAPGLHCPPGINTSHHRPGFPWNSPSAPSSGSFRATLISSPGPPVSYKVSEQVLGAGSGREADKDPLVHLAAGSWGAGFGRAEGKVDLRPAGIHAGARQWTGTIPVIKRAPREAWAINSYPAASGTCSWHL